MRFPDFQFDRISFWLGFIAATIFWWVLTIIRPMLPRLRDQIREAMKAFSERNLAGAEQYLLRETLRRAQRMHLAAPLFSLDEILVAPRLIAPPPQARPDVNAAPDVPITTQVLPYLPDWPELTCPLGVPTITLAEAMQHGSHIAIIGQPGSGKTVALAHLAAQLSRPAPLDEEPAQPRPLPLYLHVFDLDTSLTEDVDPLTNLRQSIIHLASVIAQPQITRFFQTVFESRMSKQWQPILLLDGMDELPPEELQVAARYLRALLRQHPEIQAVVAAPPSYVDGLARAGFMPLGIASWSAAQRIEFLDRWGSLWVNQFLPEIKKQVPEPNIEPLLINSWLLNEISSESPLEWTLKVWAAYAGDLNGSGASHLLETYIQRHLAMSYRGPVNSLAHKWVTRTTASVNFDEMEQILSGLSISEPLSAVSDAAVEGADPKKKKRKGKLSQEAEIVSQGERIIGILMNAGLLVRHSAGKMRFISPVVLGYLSGSRLTPEEVIELTNHLDWTTGAQTLRFVAACNPQAAWVATILHTDTAPLYRGLLTAARWLPDVAPNAEWRSALMRQLVSLIQNESLPVGMRARFAAAFILSRDPSSAKLFRQLLISRSPIIRRIAAMACGALGLSSAMNDILGLLADPDVMVRNTACVAIAALPGEQALNTIVEILMQSDEDLRQIAAETISMRPADGQKLLEAASTSDDLVTRRAAVAGLLRIREDWSRQRLEKVAIEDSQWIVRNAASQALEAFEQPNPFVPRRLPAPSECPWLLTFASRMGMGILPDKPATSVLLAALKSGSPEEQMASLEYLRNDADEAVVGVIYNSLYGDQDELHEPALLAIWWIALTGAKLPNPTQFGLG